MTILIISNIVQWAFIIFIITKRYFSLPWIEFVWNKTFFGKVRYGFRVMYWRKSGYNSSIGKRIVEFNWVNKNLLNDKPYSRPKSLWAKPAFLLTKNKAE